MKTANFSYPDSGLFIEYAMEGATASLAAYGGKPAALLNPVYEFLNDGNYVLGIRSIPSTQQQNASNIIQPNQTYEDNINVPEGSFLTMISAVGDDGSVSSGSININGPFRLRIFDVGSQSYLSDDFVHYRNTSGFISSQHLTGQPFYGLQLANTNNFGSEVNAAFRGFGPFILPSPISVSSPGQLTVQIVNLSSRANQVDMAFYFAIPIGDHVPVSPASLSGNFNRSSIR